MNALNLVKRAARQQAALLACIATLSLAAAPFAHAGPGHDHGDAPLAANSSGPQRLPDGSVFVPKPAQHQIGVRTTPVAVKEHSRSIEMPGTIVVDPNAGGKVQAMLAGRLLAGPKGFPSVGQAVRRGDVLAYVVPSAGAIERSNQTAQVAELKAGLGLAEKRLARQRLLEDTVPRKEIEATEAEIASLRERIGALGSGLTTRDVLTAPVAGVIAASHGVQGQVVEAGGLVFDIVDPARVRVEALAYEPGTAGDVGEAFLVLDGKRTALKFIGASRTLRDQAQPLQFAGPAAALQTLSIGQRVNLVVRSRSTVKAYAVPSAALVKSPSNQTIVWVKQSAERFVPKVVAAQPLDGESVAVTSGLEDGDRVVTRAATLVNQIR